MSTPRSQSRSLSPAWTRRAWLVSVGAVIGVARLTAQQLPPGVGVAATPPCDPATTPTPVQRVDGYRAGAPWDAGSAGADTVLSVTGTVSGVRCGLIAGATVDWWHAGDPSRRGRRGRTRTDRDGRYRFETPLPAPRAGTRDATVLGLRVDVPGRAVFTTGLFLPDALAGARNRGDQSFEPRRALTLLDRRGGRVSASFNVILDL